MTALLDLKPRQCRFPRGEGTPYDFCGVVTDGRPYCPEHDALCHSGVAGKQWQSLYYMMTMTEQTIVPCGRGGARVNNPGEVYFREGGALDEVLCAAADYYDVPGGLMART